MYSDVVRAARLARGLTQAQLAETTGIKQSNISAIERGRRRPSLETWHQLLLGCGFELVAAAGPLEIAVPASVDDVVPEPFRTAPGHQLTESQHNRALVAALEASEATLRSRIEAGDAVR